MAPCPISAFFFFNDTATTEIYTLSLHDALPISQHHCPADLQLHDGDQHLLHPEGQVRPGQGQPRGDAGVRRAVRVDQAAVRSEEHTSELQSQSNLVCRLLLEKKKHTIYSHDSSN